MGHIEDDTIEQLPKYWSIAQVSALTGVHVKTLTRYANEGKIRAYRLGEWLAIPDSEVERLKEAKANNHYKYLGFYLKEVS
jgi:excisionase family DNA binding protein